MASRLLPDPQRRFLTRSIIPAFAGNFIYALAQAGTFVILAKQGIPAVVGQYALGLAMVTPIMLFTKLQLRSVLATDLRGEHLFRDYWSVRLFTTALSFGAVLALLAVLDPSPSSMRMVLVVAVIKSAEGAGDLLYGLFQRHEQWGCISTSMVLKGVGSLAVLWAVCAITGMPPLGLLAVAGWHIVVAGWIDFPRARKILSKMEDSLRPSPNQRALWRLARLALPLGLAATLVSLITQIPRYVIDSVLGEESLGYFAALTQVAASGGVLIQAVGQAATPRLTRYAQTDARAFRSLLGWMLGFAAALGCAGVLVAAVAGRPLLAVLYRPDYGARDDVLVWLMAGAGVTYVSSILGYAMTACRLFREQVPLFAFAGATGLIVSLACVPSQGLVGAAYATIGSWSACAAGGAFVLVRGRKRPESGRALRATKSRPPSTTELPPFPRPPDSIATAGTRPSTNH